MTTGETSFPYIEDDRSQVLQQQQQLHSDSRIIYPVTEGLKSKYTQATYRVAFNHFLDVTIRSNDLRALLNTKRIVVEDKIIQHVKLLKEVERLNYNSILVHVSAILHFFEINDYDDNGGDIRRKRIRRFLPEDESDRYARDRPYSVVEIEQILSKCDVRDRAAILIMASTGMRIGGLRELQLEDIKKIDEFGLYLIWVYNRSGRSRYYTFCSPECARAIDDYLEYRRRIGEQLKDRSPLIRDKFSRDNYFKAPRLLSIRTISLLFEEVLKKAAVNQPKPDQKNEKNRRDIMPSHGYRKFFINQCIRAGLTDSTWKQLVGHKLPKTNDSYIRSTEEYLLAEYVKVVPFLGIDQTQRLRQENTELRKNQDNYLAELGELRQDFNEMKMMLTSLQSKESKAKLVDQFYRKAADKYQEEWYASDEAKEYYSSKSATTAEEKSKSA